jgi:hypothetical protein
MLAATKMDACADRRCQAWVVGDDQDEAARPAESGQVAAQRFSLWVVVMAQDDPGAADRQGGDCGAGVGQAVVIGEQPEGWQRPGLRRGTPPRTPSGGQTGPAFPSYRPYRVVHRLLSAVVERRFAVEFPIAKVLRQVGRFGSANFIIYAPSGFGGGGGWLGV